MPPTRRRPEATETAEPAEVAEPPTIDAGNTAWMLTSTALVLMMAIPGLALFYAGMVRKKNVLSVLMQVFATVCVSGAGLDDVGYSLAFSDGINGRRPRPVMLSGVTVEQAVPRSADLIAGSPWFSAIDPGIGLHDVPDDLLRDHARH